LDRKVLDRGTDDKVVDRYPEFLPRPTRRTCSVRHSADDLGMPYGAGTYSTISASSPNLASVSRCRGVPQSGHGVVIDGVVE